MKEKIYKLTLTTLSNLHIGSGQVYRSFEYFVKDGKFCLLDQEKLFEELIKIDKVDEFIKRITNITTNRDRYTKELLNELGIENVEKLILECYEGNVEEDGDEVILTKISAHKKDALGNFYVPGSSIKGFLKKLGDEEFGKNVGDYISITDSKPLKKDSIWISRYGYYGKLNKKMTTFVSKSYTNYVKFIKPNTKIEFIIKVQETKDFNIQTVLNRLAEFNQNYYNIYLSRFVNTLYDFGLKFDNMIENEVVYAGNIFRLGGYTNYLVKNNYVNRVKNYEELYDLILKDRNSESSYKEETFYLHDEKWYSQLESVEKYKIYPQKLKVSLNPDGIYKENGICSYEIKEVKA